MDEHNLSKNSMLYWYPKIEKSDMLKPRTIMVKLKNTDDRLMPICGGDFSPLEEQWDEILTAARSIGFPLFMRTDEFSAKHGWEKTCYVPKEEDLKTHISNLFEESFMADILGLPIRALVFREYIQMNNLFKAFHGNMPVNPEIRIFIKNGKLLCHHWYWVKDAIRAAYNKELPNDWEEIIDMHTKMTFVGLVILEAEKKICPLFKGYWSVDFCQAKDGKWILIDMAKGEESWHPEDCRIYKEVKHPRLKFVGLQ